MGFRSILFGDLDLRAFDERREEPESFRDLNLDQVVASVTALRDEYDLRPFFHVPLDRVAAVRYRHEVFRDLEEPAIRAAVDAFAHRMRTMRECLAVSSRLHYAYQEQRWFLDAADAYGVAVIGLADDLRAANPRSEGLRALSDDVAAYSASEAFATLPAETRQVRADLGGVRYCLHISGNRIKVSRYDGEPDYGAEVEWTFEKFKQGAPKEYRFRFPSVLDMNHVEAAVLDRVARLHPEVFASLEQFCDRHRDFLDDTLASFDREVQFYLAYLDHVERFRSAGLPVCYPEVTDRSKEVEGRAVYDLALANRLLGEGATVVTNDFHLREPERILVVSGPNQGGKTTFARTFGQLHYLAALGCPVPGSSATLFLFDRLFTHFEREEDLQNLSGKLEDDLQRIRGILEEATPNSVLIMNESFSSTTLRDALFLSTHVMSRVVDRDMLGLTVTFLDELASLGETTVSLVGTVDPEDPARRTFKLARRPADGLAYAAAIAEKHGLTYRGVKRRLAP